MSAKPRPRILIVDDSPVNIRILSEILKPGHEIVFATTGKHALELAGRGGIDLILLDIVMPEMDGFEVCRRLKAGVDTRDIPVIFISALGDPGDKISAFNAGGIDYIAKPLQSEEVQARVRTHLDLVRHQNVLEELVQLRTRELEASREALREALGNLRTTEITRGVYWVQVPEAGLYVLCGSPGEVIKHMMRTGFISTVTDKGISYETGPNAILLSDLVIQNGGFSNLAEFPVLQMLYRQGMILPGHPNNTGAKPTLIGTGEQVRAQMEYVYRGNYGLTSLEEIVAAGVDPETAEQIMRVKLKFAHGRIEPTDKLLDTVVAGLDPVEIRNGVRVRRLGFNHYEFSYRGRSTEVDLNLAPGEVYESPYAPGFYEAPREEFAVVHSGEGDGWDPVRQSMSSVLISQGRVFLIDAHPNVLHTLESLGIDISEVEGVFHTHAHDDHFAGLPTLIQSGHRIKYYATPLVRASVQKKFAALMSVDENLFSHVFEIRDLRFDEWNDCGGLEVKPLYSPHPVENNLFLFRVMGDKGYRTYAHWADLSSFDVLDGMTGAEAERDVSMAFVERVKKAYLTPAHLKKLDVGGGLIHGEVQDFCDDQSGKLLLAHIARPLDDAEKEIGSQASFGAVDVLIPSRQDYLRRYAYIHLTALFPWVTQVRLSGLINSSSERFNAGSILQKSGLPITSVFMILSGSVSYIDAASRVHNRLANGSLIGEQAIFADCVALGTWRAVSHVRVLRWSLSVIREFVERNGVTAEMKEMLDGIGFLRGTWLFGEQNSFAAQHGIAQALRRSDLVAGEALSLQQERRFWVIRRGRIQVLSRSGDPIEVLKEGDFFGEYAYLGGPVPNVRLVAEGPAMLYELIDYPLLDIPIVHWKLLETFERRKQRWNPENVQA